MRYTVTYDIEVDSEAEAYEGIPSDAQNESVYANTGTAKDMYTVPFGQSVLVRATDGEYILATVTGWCREESPFHNAQHIKLPANEIVMIAHVN